MGLCPLHQWSPVLVSSLSALFAYHHRGLIDGWRAAYDRFITIWLENTDFDSAAASESFQKIAAQGILLTNYNGVTHPSEPNYVAASECVARFMPSLADMAQWLATSSEWAVTTFTPFHTTSRPWWISSRRRTCLGHRTVSSTLHHDRRRRGSPYGNAEEDLPYDGDGDFSHASPNYINETAGNYTYYVRKPRPADHLQLRPLGSPTVRCGFETSTISLSMSMLLPCPSTSGSPRTWVSTASISFLKRSSFLLSVSLTQLSERCPRHRCHLCICLARLLHDSPS